jgi:hypothetical protein
MVAKTALPEVDWAADQEFNIPTDEEKGAAYMRTSLSLQGDSTLPKPGQAIAQRFGNQGNNLEIAARATSSQKFLNIAFANKGPPCICFGKERVLYGVSASKRQIILIVLALQPHLERQWWNNPHLLLVI